MTSPSLASSPPTAPRALPLLTLLTLLAIALRVALALRSPFIFPDSADYHTLATALAHGQTYAANGFFATRMPGYPLFLAGIYLFTGPSAAAGILTQAILSASLVPLAYVIARRLTPRAALPAALLVALDPLTIAFSAALLSESLFTLALLAALYTSIRILDGAHPFYWLLLALICIIAVYLRASVIYFVPLLAIFLVRAAPGKSLRHLPWAITLLALVAASLLPWQLRNYALFKTAPFALTSLEGISLYESVYPDATGGPRQDLLQPPPEMAHLNEMQRSQAWSKLAWQCIRDEPLRITKLAFVKLARTWSPFFNTDDFNRWPIQLASAAWHIPLFILALYGLLRARGPGRSTILILLLLPILYFSLLHSLFLGSVRYRVPLMPIVCIFAGVGLAHLAARFVKRGEKCANP